MKVGFMISVTVTISLLLGCAGVEKSFVTTRPTKLNVTSTHKDLISLPAPQEKIVVGVYKFQDQTGQFKPKENTTSFSTAVTQVGTSMLMKALVDSGWFIPAEREGLPNLLNEQDHPVNSDAKCLRTEEWYRICPRFFSPAFLWRVELFPMKPMW